MGSNVGGLPEPTGLLENVPNGRLQTGSRIFADEDEDNMAGGTLQVSLGPGGYVKRTARAQEASDRGKACEFPERITPAH